MELGLVRRGLDFTRRRKRWMIVLGLIGFSSYSLYKVYHIPSVVRKKRRIVKLLGAMLSMAEMVADSAETISVLSKDLKEFLNSNSDEIPNSLKQLTKIALSEESSESVVRVARAMTVGILRGYRLESKRGEIQELGFPDRVMDKLMSTAGTGFVSVVAGSFAKNLVLGFYANVEGSNGLSNTSTLSSWVDVVSDDKCRVVMGECIKNFVSTAVTIYLDKTMDVNFYDEMFSGLTNPNHQVQMKDMLVTLCNGVVETLVKTSHQVLTASKSNVGLCSCSSCSLMDHDGASSMENDRIRDLEVSSKQLKERNSSFYLRYSGWMDSVSSTLAIPSNRKFLLDVTSRVTFETVRSVIEFFLWKIMEGLRKSLNIVHDEVVDRGLEVIRYVGMKSSVIFTICLAFVLHVITPQALLHA